ncbi:MAG: protein-L-isoaspartate O-methyltransferase, partial [Candidatus Cloacimonetes bacterium]|nr:protein-L-isoaspartate O-methyltransferase [Candidatus Cloacimonadota bacterium]
MRFEDKRRLMVENQIIARGIRSPRLIEAFLKVERHEFVPELIAHFAYADHPLSIGEGQTISQPYIVAYMIDLLNIEETDSVLEIGTGSGYQTAILAEMAKEVFTVEKFDFLAQNARKILKKLKYKNINFDKGDGTMGWTKSYPSISKF